MLQRSRAFSMLADRGGHSPSTVLAAKEPAPLLLCLSHLRWDFVWQRPQHLLSRAAKHFQVVFFEEPLYEKTPVPRLDVTDRPGGIRVAVPILPDGMERDEEIEHQKLMLDGLVAAASGRLVLWYYTPMAMAFSAHLDADAVVYDNMDELSAFRGASAEMLAYEDRLFERADLVFTGGLSLYEAKRHRHPRVHAFPSSIDTAHFASARGRAAPAPTDQRDIPGPRVGFFGVIDERLDVDLVERVASARPDWSFVMIGPVVKIEPEILPRRPNIYWLGSKPYSELPAYLAGWDAGLMPFALNEATRFISPTKTPEFLAAGLPVVSTPITDVIRPYGEKGLVEIAADADQAIAALDMLFQRRRDTWLSRVDRHLAKTSWDKTWAGMQRLISAELGDEGGRVSLALDAPSVSFVPAE